MIARIAGVHVDVEPDRELTPDERALLQRAGLRHQHEPQAPAINVRLRRIDEIAPGRNPAPARIDWNASHINITHPRFTASIRIDGWSTVIERSPGDTFALRITLRVLLAAILPSRGALPLHSAGVILKDAGVICFGESGAGKTTISAAASTPVVSDELTVASTANRTIFATGLLENDRVLPATPLKALFALDRGPGINLERLAPAESFRALLRSTMVPSVPVLWRQVAPVAAELVRSMPIYRLKWTPGQPVWRHIAAALDLEASPDHPIDRSRDLICEHARSC